MHLQPTLRQPSGNGVSNKLSLLLALAVNNRVIAVTLELQIRESLRHPHRTRNARTGWLTTVRSMSLAACLDPAARVRHPPAGAGPSASAPRTVGSTARRYV